MSSWCERGGASSAGTALQGLEGGVLQEHVGKGMGKSILPALQSAVMAFLSARRSHCN